MLTYQFFQHDFLVRYQLLYKLKAANSLYYSDNKDKKLEDHVHKSKHFKAEANFGGTVNTYSLWNVSRILMEMAMLKYKGSRVYNVNDGVLINGATPLKPDHIIFKPYENKENEIDKLLSENFISPDIKAKYSQEYLNETFINDFSKLRKELKLPSMALSAKDVTQYTYDIWQTVRELEKTNVYLYGIIKGSIQSYFYTLYKICSLIEPGENFNKAYQIIRAGYHEYLDFSIKLLSEECLKLDDMTERFTPDDVQFNQK
jgi:hypothetical protein